MSNSEEIKRLEKESERRILELSRLRNEYKSGMSRPASPEGNYRLHQKLKLIIKKETELKECQAELAKLSN